VPSSGSIFRNPDGQSAGALIEAAGLKGKKLGYAEVSDLHANWIVNPNRQASTKDVLALLELCQVTVSERVGVDLRAELVSW
jgi:UDP-N-acetylmuramate dehydrogenase